MWDERRKEFNTDPDEVLGERTHGWKSIWHCDSQEARARTNNAIKGSHNKSKGCRSEKGQSSHQ